MKKKVFSLMMTLLLAFIGVAKAELVEVGVGGTATNSYLPAYTLYNNTLSEQIYTAEEIGMAGTINSIAFYNGGSTKTPNLKIYMVNTDVTAFGSTTSWLPVTASDLVFEGSVTMTASEWTTITLTTPFEYDGSNLGLIVDENMNWSSGLACRVFDGDSNCSMYVYSDGTDYNAVGATYTASNRLSVKNQLQLDITPAGEAAQLTVNDGTATNSYVPAYGFYADAYLKCEMVYPASELSAMNGGTINGITFYASSPAAEAWTSTWQVFVSEVSNATISSYYGPGTVVYEGALNGTGTEMTINFTTPYQYNGGNLLIGVYNITTGNYKSITWVGETVNGASVQGYSYSDLGSISATQRNFLPKTTFDYTTGDGPDYEVINAIEIEGFEMPAWGVTPEDHTYVPEDANYTLEESHWYTYNPSRGETKAQGRLIEPDPNFTEEGLAYYMSFYVSANEGYGFTNNTVAYLNGDASLWDEDYCYIGEDEAILLTRDFFPSEAYEEGLHTYAMYGVGENAYENIDRLLIERPNGAWMEPYHFQLYNDGAEDVDVVLIDFLHNNGYFSMVEETEYPFTVAATGMPGVDLYINTNIDWTDTDEINSLLAVNTNERSTHLYPIIAAPYQPFCPDVVETAYNIGTIANEGSWSMWTSEMWNEINPNEPYELHDNYTLPFPNIPEGYDAVMQFTLTHDMVLNAYVSDADCYDGPRDEYNGKVALYRKLGDEPVHPMADNYYDGRPFHNEGGGAITYTSIDFETGNFSQFNDYTNDATYPWYVSADAAHGGSYGMRSGNAGVHSSTSTFTATVTYTTDGTVSFDYNARGEGSYYLYDVSRFYIDNVLQFEYGADNTWRTFSADVTAGQHVFKWTYTKDSSVNNTGDHFAVDNIVFDGGRMNVGGRDIILHEDFDGIQDDEIPAGWAVAGGDDTYGETWFGITASTFGASLPSGTNGGMMSASYWYGSCTPDNWLITPNIEGATQVTYTYGVNTAYAGDHYALLASSTGTNLNDFSVVYEETPTGSKNGGYKLTADGNNDRWTASWVTRTVNLPAGTKYVAFHHYNCYDMNFLLLDEITFIGSNVPVDPEQPDHVFTAGPVIEGLNVLAGTYYLVASSTCQDFEVSIEFEELPCPIEPVTGIYPEDNAFDIPSNDLTLRWTLNDYANEYRLVFSSTYWPDDEPNHPATYIGEWTSDLAESFRITDVVTLWNNTNYFWRIDQRSNPGTPYECVTIGPVFGFTTTLNVPQNLQASQTRIFEYEDTVTLSWNAIQDRDRTYRRYRIYMDGEMIHQTPNNQVVTSWVVPQELLTYNMYNQQGYIFNVTAVYDEGESPMSNPVEIWVSGNGSVSGTVWEQDGETPIGGVTVTLTGTNEFGDPEVYTFVTDEDGTYEGNVHAGNYTNAVATMAGYQDATTIHPLPFNVVYDEETPNVDFIMDELFIAPAHVCAEPVYVQGVQGDTLVHVWWDFNFCEDYEAQIGTGTSTTGYFPFYTLYNYSIATTLYKADELEAAGANTAPISSLSWYATNAPGYNQQGITIWMANVTDNTVSTTSPLASGMTKVYTGAMTPAMGWNEFVFNEGEFAWDGESNILILVQRNNGSWNSTVNWQGSSVSGCMAYLYTDSAPYNVENQTYNLSAGTTRPNIKIKGTCDRAVAAERSLHHFNIYRTDCYNDGPYNSDNTTFLSTVWRPDTSYMDVQWPEVPVGVYKYGVSAVYAGNYEGNPNNPRVDYPFEERESEIVWHNMCSPCIDKDMYLNNEVTVNVVLNSADSPEGVQVDFLNLNPGEEQLHHQDGVTLDQTGYYVFPRFRKGDYLVTVSLPGYYTLEVEESIWEPRDLRYVLIEIICKVQNLYVSRTGWAMWDPQDPCPETVTPDDPTGGETFTYNFEGDYQGWTNIINGEGNGWHLATEVYTGVDGYGANGSNDFMMGSSYVNFGSYPSYDCDDYLVSPQAYAISNGATLSFYHDVYSSYYPDYMEVCVSTAATPTASSFTAIWNNGGERRANGNANRDTNLNFSNRMGNWTLQTLDLSAYAGQNIWIAFHHEAYDQWAVMLDDVTVTTGGGRAVTEERHLEGYKVMCTSIDGEPIFNHNTPAEQPFCQVATNGLVEGNHYICKVAAIYSTGMSEYEQVEWQYEPCDNYTGTVNGLTVEGSTVSWEYPGEGVTPGPNPGEATTFNVGFEGGLPEGWTTIDGNNDGYTWCATSAIPTTWTYYASLSLDWYHNGTDAMCSGSYINGVGALHPDEYLVSPQVTLAAGSQLSFWVAATDASYPADHFGVFISDNGTSNWTSVQEWTLTAKSGGFGSADACVRNTVGRENRATRLGTWYNYTVDLSAYAGQKYIAFRHFNCTDQYIMCLDDVELGTGRTNRAPWDLMMTFTAPEAAQYGVAFDGENFYTSNWGYASATHNFYKYDMEGNMLEGFEIAGCGTLRGMTTDGTYTYGVANANTVYCIDLASHTLVSTFTSSYGAMRGITYDPVRDGFWVIGNWSGNLTLIDRTGAIQQVGPAPSSASDLAYYKDENDVEHIYCFNNGTNDVDDWVIGNAAMGIPVFNFSSVPGFASGTSGGCTVATINGKVAFIGDIQQSPNLIGVYELRDGDVEPTPVPAEGIRGAVVFVDGEFEAFVDYPATSYTYEGDGQEVCVRMVYAGDAILPDNNFDYAMSCEECIGGLEPTCEPGAPIYAEVTADDQVRVYWSEPVGPQPGEGDTWMYDFENSSLEGLTTIDGDGDGYNWVLGSAIGGVYLVSGASLAGSGHNASNDMVCSGSFSNATGNALNPNNFLVFPQSAIVEGSTFSFWACGQDASWVQEHFGVAVSTTGNTSATDFATIAEWTMTAKAAKAANAVRDGRAQGNWYQYTVDLSDYAGMDVYIAIRHFNCTDMFILDVDDVELSVAAKGNRDGIVSYNIYRSEDNVSYSVIGNVPGTATEYFDNPGEGTFYYQVTAVYADCESEPAISGEDPTVNYVMVGRTGIGENSTEVNLFPNPTKGNVTIQAMNMHRITVVSVLGQVVFDTELDQDEYILNMAQFNTGMYMVRVYTDEGVAVKRVTVLH